MQRARALRRQADPSFAYVPTRPVYYSYAPRRTFVVAQPPPAYSGYDALPYGYAPPASHYAPADGFGIGGGFGGILGALLPVVVQQLLGGDLGGVGGGALAQSVLPTGLIEPGYSYGYAGTSGLPSTYYDDSGFEHAYDDGYAADTGLLGGNESLMQTVAAVFGSGLLGDSLGGGLLGGALGGFGDPLAGFGGGYGFEGDDSAGSEAALLQSLIPALAG